MANFHTWRLPVPSLWPDILEKTKAAGLNAISIYTHMGLVNPSRGVVDFDGFRALKPLYEAAMAAGIWVVYINAETSAGGIAHWITAEVAGRLRTNDSDWTDAWQDYIRGIIEETAPYQINVGGPVIGTIQLDNEYTQDYPGHGEYYEELKAVYHNSDIVVPLTYNDPNQGEKLHQWDGRRRSLRVWPFANSDYCYELTAGMPVGWTPIRSVLIARTRGSFRTARYTEFQAGSYDAWGPSAPGYGPCAELTGPAFQSVFNLQLWASNAKLINYYMLYGGTSWGGLPFPCVHLLCVMSDVNTDVLFCSAEGCTRRMTTARLCVSLLPLVAAFTAHAESPHFLISSYIHTQISESRALTPKYDELKLQGLFVRSSPDFVKTDWVGDSRDLLSGVASSPEVFVTLLRNPDSGTAFYILRQNDSTSTATVNFKLSVDTLQGRLQLPLVAPAITLAGRESKVIVADYAFGHSTLAYSTAAVFFAGIIDGRDVLFLHGSASQAYEFALQFTGTPNPWLLESSAHLITSRSTDAHIGTIITLLPGVEGLVTIYDSDTQLILFADTPTAATFWAPALNGAVADPFRAFWGIGTTDSVLVGGPYLVRSAALEQDGTLLALRGDLKEDVRLTVIGPRGVRSITWNGLDIGGGDFMPASGVSVYSLDTRASFAAAAVRVPKLTGWRYADSLPEIGAEFDDSEWKVADNTETNVPEKMWYGDGRVLYGCDYGFCENVVLWRGHFDASGAERSVNLSINGGEAFAASVWLNDVFLNTSYGKDNMGLNETDGDNADSSKNPRGVRGFALDGVVSWNGRSKERSAATLRAYPDKTRGVFNEGGLFGERCGWHLPGFDTSAWEARELSDGLPYGGAGVGFFVSTFELDMEDFLDVHMSFTFEESLGAAYRAFSFVNGWMMGKRVANLGPQAEFPVPEGILNYHGENTVAVALWSMEAEPISPSLRLVVDGIYDSALGMVHTNNPRWSSEGRLVP
ncbi:hypothetical protein MSAN_00424700 [Mycena sanguinolenta]|uniref:beta-galactosidase n=1 Tax=Mycena sanguinolenta TaxID=230812 RepID=A0A8H7DJB2_9AGAR|nr:hypothetical protein MSAN_00424700 [Mycena sanguinolenta]